MINLKHYTFYGPYTTTDSFEHRAGVYAILDCKNGNNYSVLDVGESFDVKSRVDNHDREQCWVNNRYGVICYAVLYTPNLGENGRRVIEKELRGYYCPVCGVI